MFANTLDLAILGSTITFTRINQDKYSSEYLYKDSNGEIRFNIRNTSYVDKRRGNLRVDRHNVEFVFTSWATGGALHDTVYKTYAVFEVDSDASVTTASTIVPGVMAFLSAANVIKLGNFES